jgi:hypothetical protein
VLLDASLIGKEDLKMVVTRRVRVILKPCVDYLHKAVQFGFFE